LLQSEPAPAARAGPGHSLFVFIRLYADGHVRLGGFLLILVLASGSADWTAGPVERGSKYTAALEPAAVHDNNAAFTRCPEEEMKVCASVAGTTPTQRSKKREPAPWDGGVSNAARTRHGIALR
jgi:hypothetical protein